MPNTSGASLRSTKLVDLSAMLGTSTRFPGSRCCTLAAEISSTRQLSHSSMSRGLMQRLTMSSASSWANAKGAKAHTKSKQMSRRTGVLEIISFLLLGRAGPNTGLPGAGSASENPNRLEELVFGDVAGVGDVNEGFDHAVVRTTTLDHKRVFAGRDEGHTHGVNVVVLVV